MLASFHGWELTTNHANGILTPGESEPKAVRCPLPCRMTVKEGGPPNLHIPNCPTEMILRQSFRVKQEGCGKNPHGKMSHRPGPTEGHARSRKVTNGKTMSFRMNVFRVPVSPQANAAPAD